MQPIRVRANLRAIAVNVYSTFPKAQALLEPHHQIVQCHIQDTRWGSLTPLQRCSLCILQPFFLIGYDQLRCVFNVCRYAFNFSRCSFHPEIQKMMRSVSYVDLIEFKFFFLNVPVFNSPNQTTKRKLSVSSNTYEKYRIISARFDKKNLASSR